MVHQITDVDIQSAISILKELKGKVTDVTSHFQELLQKVQDGQYNTTKGISFLEVKYQLLLSYLINLTHVMYTKTAGKSIQGEPSVERLVEIRTVLEKMRPIDQKLKYQIDKVIKTAKTGTLATNDPLRFKPNPENLVSKLEDESGSGSEEEGKDEAKGVYKPPKLAAVHYDGDLTEKEKQEQRLEKAKKRALSSNIMRELRDEYYEGPEEIRDTTDSVRMREDKEAKERLAYEEERFVRLPVTKKRKATAMGMSTMSALSQLTHFDDISALTHDDGTAEMEGVSKKKKSRKQGKAKGKKGSKKKRRFKP